MVAGFASHRRHNPSLGKQIALREREGVLIGQLKDSCSLGRRQFRFVGSFVGLSAVRNVWKHLNLLPVDRYTQKSEREQLLLRVRAWRLLIKY